MNRYEFEENFQLDTDLLDCKEVYVGRHDYEDVPELTARNIQLVIEKHNKLIEFLAEKLEFEE